MSLTFTREGLHLAPRVDKTNDARRDEVFAVGTATPRVESAGSDGPGEVQVREDALVDHRVLRHVGLHAAPPTGTPGEGKYSGEEVPCDRRYAARATAEAEGLAVGRRFEGVVQGGYGVGVQVMSDPVLIARMAHHFSTFRPVPGTLNVLLPDPFDQSLFTSRLTSAELGGNIEDHPYAPVIIEGTIPGLVVQTLNPRGDQPSELVELIADRHLRTTLGLTDGARITFELT